MKGTKELTREIGKALIDAARRNRRKTFLVAGATVLILVSLSFYGLTVTNEHGKEQVKETAHKEAVHKEDEHEEAAVVHLSEEAQKASGIAVMATASELFSVPIEATAVIELNGDRVAKISPRTSGRLMKITASQGDAVKAGQALAWFDSPELGQARAEYAKTKGRTELARKSLQREETLFARKISPEKDVIRARQEVAEAEADLAYASERFHLLGIDIGHSERKETGDQHPLIAVTSPINGSVIERTATQGEVVSPDKTLFVVADLSKLWVIIDIYEKDLGRVRKGTAVKVVTTAYADKTFRGVISYLGEVMDEKTRTVKARVEVENANRLLKPGMFATVSIDVKGASMEKALLVSDEAVLMDGEERFVFVMTGPGAFEKREVRLGRMFGKNVEVVEGLEIGEKVAVAGAFILKSELKKGELVDEHGHDK